MNVITRVEVSTPSAVFLQLGQLHVDLIHSGILEVLGAAFVGTLYQELMRGAQTVIYVAFHEGQPIGFLVGTPNLNRSLRSIGVRGGARLLAAASCHLWRPRVLRAVILTLGYFFRRSPSASPDVASVEAIASTRAEVLAIAVSTEAQGRGIGKALVAAFERDLHACGSSGRYFVSTNAEEVGSNAFYRTAGFNLMGQKPHHDLVLNIYARDLPV